MLSCKDVSCLVGHDELDRVSLARRLAVRFHLLYCRYCRRHARQLRLIGEAARAAAAEDAGYDGDGAGPARREQLKREILRKAEETAGR